MWLRSCRLRSVSNAFEFYDDDDDYVSCETIDTVVVVHHRHDVCGADGDDGVDVGEISFVWHLHRRRSSK